MLYRQLTSPITFGITQNIVGVDGGAPIPNGTITVAPRGSVWFNGTTDYYTMPDSASLNFANADWTVGALVKFTRSTGALSSTQHICAIGNTGSTHNVQLFLAGQQLQGIIRTSGSASTTATGATFTINNTTFAAGWHIIGIRRTGTNYQVFSCPLNGVVTNGATQAITTPGVITPVTGTAGAVSFATRTDASTSRHFQGFISYGFKVDAAMSDADIQALAAGSDLVTDLAFSPSLYVKLDSAASTISDSGTTGTVATRSGTPQSRGGPDWSGRAIRVGNLNGRLDAVYGYVFQRASGGTSRTISFSGTYAGSPAGIEARVINSSGTGVTSWTRCATPSAGVWTVSLTVPQGGELALEVRDTVTTANFQRTQLPWGVGAVLLFTGESIADQQASGSAFADTASSDYSSSVFAHDRHQTAIWYARDPWTNGTTYTTGANPVYVIDLVDNSFWRLNTTHTAPASGTFATDRTNNPAQWTQVTLEALQVDTLNSGNGTVMHTVDRIRKYAGVPCMAVFGAKTGSKLASGDSAWGSPYTNTLTHGKLQAAIAVTETDYEAIYWVQGANDANDSSPPSAATYQAALEALIPQIRTYITGRTASTLPVIIPITGTNTAGTSAVDAGWRAVRNGTKAAIATITNALDGSEMYDLAHGDALHPSAAGYIRLGKRQAQALLNYLLPGTYTNPMTGASVVSATRNGGGTHINVVFTLNFGTTLQGLTGSTGLTGFRVLRSGVAQSITAAVVQSTNTIRLSGSFNAGDVVDYIDIQNPVITNNVYTNAPVIGDAAGVPVRAFTAGITV
jgi:hypothetical protein